MNARDHRVKTLDSASYEPRACVIFAKPAGAHQFGWGWTSSDQTRRSKGYFRYFYECVQDARKHGYEVDFARVAEHLKSAAPNLHV